MHHFQIAQYKSSADISSFCRIMLTGRLLTPYHHMDEVLNFLVVGIEA